MSGQRITGLGSRIDRKAPVRFTFNGRSFSGFAGDTLASALLAAGESLFSEHRKRHGEGWVHLRKYFADITLARARWSGKPSRRFRVRPALS